MHLEVKILNCNYWTTSFKNCLIVVPEICCQVLLTTALNTDFFQVPPVLSWGDLTGSPHSEVPQLEDSAPAWDWAQQAQLQSRARTTQGSEWAGKRAAPVTSRFYSNILNNNHKVVFLSITSRYIANSNTLVLNLFILFSMKFHSVSGFGS